MSGEYLLLAIQSQDPNPVKDFSRDYMVVNLNTAKVEANHVLVCEHACFCIITC